MLEKEFKVNEFLTLKLENGETNIHVNGKLFRQCKFLLLNIPVNEIKSFDEIESIDEAAEKLDRSMERNRNKIYIPPETEFWGHCSNLQAWVENNYDTRLLHRNLAFPLLKKLADVGDPDARKVFKEEIARRFCGGNDTVVKYLIRERYLDYFNEDELDSFLKNSKVKELNLSKSELMVLPEAIGKLSSLKTLNLMDNELTTLPESIGNLSSLKELHLCDNPLTTLPESIGNLKSLQRIDLDWEKITYFPKSMSNFTFLKELNLSYNKLTTLPESIGNLKSLKTLYLYHNKLKTLPESIGNLKSLQMLDLSSNKLKTLPESIGTLK